MKSNRVGNKGNRNLASMGFPSYPDSQTIAKSGR